MPEIATIQFTQDQARTLTGVSAETMRHWRKTIPYLCTKSGKVARFSFTDLMGLAVTQELVNSFGVHIAVLRNGVDALFRLLAASRPASLEGAIVLVTATDAVIYEPESGRGFQALGQIALMVPLTPLITKMQRHVLPMAPVSVQATLLFPPEAAKDRA